MATLLIDPTWLTDSFKYKQYDGIDDYSEVLYKAPKLVTSVKVDYSPSFTRTGTEVEKIGNATIFVYAAFSKGIELGDLVEKSEVEINGKTYIVKQVNIRKEIDTANLYAVEMVIL